MDNQSNDQNQDQSDKSSIIIAGAQLKPGVIDPRHLVVPTTPRNGDMFYSDGTVFKKIAAASATGQVLTSNASGIPSFASISVTGPVSRVATGPAYIYPSTSGDTIRSFGTGTDYMDMKYALGVATISASTGPIVLTPGTSQLVKSAVLEQVATGNNYRNNAVILTGWTFVTGDGSGTDFNKSITFGITFTTAPIVILGRLGFKDSSDPTSITDFAGPSGIASVTAGSITTGGFTAYHSLTSTSTNGRRYGMAWVAYGTL